MFRSTCLLTFFIGIALGGVAFANATEPDAAELDDSTTVNAQITDAVEPEGSAEAADDAIPLDRSFFATTTVTATGRETDSFELPTPVSVIDAETIEERSPANAAELLRYEPGVDINGVGPNQSRPVIRGQRGLRILFLENGLRMNNARRQTDFGEIPALVDIDTVEAVEVVRGPASVLYGSDAIGGVLNLVTKVPSGSRGVGGGIDLRASSADEQTKARLHASGRGDAWSWSLGGTWRESEDYDAPAGSYGDVTLADSTTVVDSSVDDRGVDGYLGYRPNDRHAVYLRGHRYEADETGFGFVEPTDLGTFEPFRIRILYPYQDFQKFTVGYQGSALGAMLADTVDLQVYWQDNERELVNDIDIDIGPIFPGAPSSDVASDTLNFTDLESQGLRAEMTKILGPRQVLTYGLEYWTDDSFNTDFSRTVTTLRFPFPPFELPFTETDSVANAPNAENESLGVFVQDEISFGDRFEMILGARYQEVETLAKPTPGWDIDGLDFEDDAFVGAVNLLYAVNERFHLVASWGTAFRAPNIVERLFNGLTPEGIGFQILNPDLKSEQSENIDLGFKYQTRRATVELFYFENDIDDGIIQYFLTPDEFAQLPPEAQSEIANSGVDFVVQQRNLDRLTYEGVELIAGYRFDDGLSIGGNYSWLEGKRVDSTNPPSGDSYGTKANLWVRWQPSGRPWMLEYRLRHNGDEGIPRTAGEPPPLVGDELPAFTVHSLYGSWTFEDGGGRDHTLGLMIENLTDELYAEFSNISFFRPQPERNVVLTYRFDF